MINHPNRAKKAKKAAAEVAGPVVVESFKGFDKNLQCRGFQFEVGKSYNVTGKIEACARGFHACSNPLDVWGYYGPGDSRFAIVEQSGKMATESRDSKIASASITIKAELTLHEFIQRSVAWIIKQVDFTNAPATNTGDRSAATNTGDRSAATNTGDRSAAANTGDRSAATNTGDQSAATNTGYRSAATNTGEDAVAMASGYQGRVSGGDGCALFLVERDDNLKIISVWAGIVGSDSIKPEIFYTLKDGKPVEWVQVH